MSKKTIHTLESLVRHELVQPESLTALRKVTADLPLAITEQLYHLIDKNNPDDPIAKQFVPQVQELTILPEESADPIGDDIYTAVKGVIHRYPDRCLFTPVHVCPIYCRFCFRREKVGAADKTLTPAEVTVAFDYIRNHPEIWEVILTGGDPLILKAQQLNKYLMELSAIEHVEVLRIHTRVPVVDSQRVTAAMINAMKCNKPVYVVLHANHPNEFSPAAIRACAQFVDAGIPMLSQTLLLQGINDNIEVLSQLMRCFIKNRIKPYYLHQGDLAKGTAHFRTSIAAGKALMKQLRGRFSGLCQPTYVLDIPGGYGKVPIGPSYLQQQDCAGENHYCVEDYRGGFHHYPPHALVKEEETL